MSSLDQSNSAKDSSGPHLPTTTVSSQSAQSNIGPYKLLQPLGEGGMGTVWEAEQLQPLRRRVALKLIKVGLESKTVLARFEAERQALALMDHPNIAKVLDAGASEQGQPYFVMELVKGLPVTQYCDQAKLTLPQRLQLFIPVCQAIQHAHQKGIIHRDLKPSNILVAMYDGLAVPKVIDFGVAKAMYQPLTERTLFTEMGMLVGTPEYMAPEQAESNALAIDARVDVYSLGIILYELLTGSKPFDRRQLQEAVLLELLRQIREVEPPTPSQKLTSSDTLEEAARMRKTEPKQLGRQIKGELDWIVMKCLEKERERRYVTVNGLGQDIEHYLQGKPVTAGPPSQTYRLRKLIRRHLVPVAAGIVVLLSLVGAIVGIAWGVSQANRHRQDAQNSKSQEPEPEPERNIDEEIASMLQHGEVAHAIGGITAYDMQALKSGLRVDVSATTPSPESKNMRTFYIVEDVEVLAVQPRYPTGKGPGRVLLRLTGAQSLTMKHYTDLDAKIGIDVRRESKKR